jgi:hypothetical protein
MPSAAVAASAAAPITADRPFIGDMSFLSFGC